MDLPGIQAVARPRTRDELPAGAAGSAWLAGGTWLFSEPQPGLRALIDLAGLGWPALEPSAAGLRIGATCTIAELEAFAAPADWLAAPLFAGCCRALLGSFKIWAMATVGGNVCLSLPAAPMVALTVALDGVAQVTAGADGFALTITASTMRPLHAAWPVPPSREVLDAYVEATPPELWFDDVHGTPAWRRHMTRRLAAELHEELLG